MNDEEPSWKARFVEALQSDDPLEWSEAYAIKAPHVPTRVYRYRSLSSEYTWSNLTERREWLSRTSDFNDPFDCAPCFDHDALASDQLQREIARVAARIEEQQTKFNIVILEKEPPQSRAARISKNAEYIVKGLQSRIWACCFSSTPNSVAMWSYYADNHRGICIEYPTDDTSFSKSFAEEMYPVIYTPVRFDITKWILSAIDGHAAQQKKLVAMHKSVDWAHEREWRFIVHGPPEENVAKTLRMPKPTAIYIGCRTTAEHMARLQQLAATEGLPLRTMQLSTHAYEMQVAKD